MCGAACFQNLQMFFSRSFWSMTFAGLLCVYVWVYGALIFIYSFDSISCRESFWCVVFFFYGSTWTSRIRGFTYLYLNYIWRCMYMVVYIVVYKCVYISIYIYSIGSRSSINTWRININYAHWALYRCACTLQGYYDGGGTQISYIRLGSHAVRFMCKNCLLLHAYRIVSNYNKCICVY